MITLRQWESFSSERQKELAVARVFFPSNKYGISSGYYSDGDIVKLLRKHKTSPKCVQFIADMME